MNLKEAHAERNRLIGEGHLIGATRPLNRKKLRDIYKALVTLEREINTLNSAIPSKPKKPNPAPVPLPLHMRGAGPQLPPQRTTIESSPGIVPVPRPLNDRR